MKRTWLVLVALLSPACLVAGKATNVGTACVVPDAQADQPLQVEIRDTCYSSSLTDLKGECWVEVDEDSGDVKVVSEVFYREPSGDITDDCRDFTIYCQSDDTVPQGAYTLVYRGDRVTLDVPRLDLGLDPICAGPS